MRGVQFAGLALGLLAAGCNGVQTTADAEASRIKAEEVKRVTAEKKIGRTQDAYVAAIECGRRKFSASSSQKILDKVRKDVGSDMTEDEMLSAVRQTRRAMSAHVKNSGCSDPWVQTALRDYLVDLYPDLTW